MGSKYWLLLWVLLGLGAGWFGHHLFAGTGYGPRGDILVAILGALLGGAIYRAVAPEGRCLLVVAASCVGAFAAMLIVQSVRPAP